MLIPTHSKPTRYKMKIKCEECGTLLVNPPMTEKSIMCMDIINYEKDYIKAREEVIARFFAMYSKEINLLKKLENKIIKEYLERLKSFNEEKHKVAQKFDEKMLEDFKQWKTKQ